MSDETGGWFADATPDEPECASTAIRQGSADAPGDWSTRAVDAGFVTDETAYYDALHEATLAATRTAVREAERADDQQLVHAVRAMDDIDRILLYSNPSITASFTESPVNHCRTDTDRLQPLPGPAAGDYRCHRGRTSR